MKPIHYRRKKMTFKELIEELSEFFTSVTDSLNTLFK